MLRPYGKYDPRRAHPPNHIAKNQKATATAIATAAAAT
jgi:hypothetical protein